MRVEDFFPFCTIADCPERGRHRHILDHQREMVTSPAKFLLCSGGYGSAKTLPACVIGMQLTLAIPGNRGFVGRRTYNKLHDSTQKIFLEVLERYERQTGDHFERRENRDGFPHRLVSPHGSEVLFRETKDLGRFLGPEYGWFLIDEAIEEPETTLTRLMGRLRLPRAAGYLKGMFLTNPPDHRHWLIKWFGSTPGFREIEDPELKVVTRFHYIKSKTSENRHLPPGYLATLKLLDPNEYRRVVSGELGFTADGPPVYPTFKHGVHVGAPEYRPDVPLLRGWDFGFRHPACVWGQTWRCRVNRLHTALLHEFDGEQIEAEAFGGLVIMETRRAFRGISPRMIQDAGDAAGAAVSDKGPGAIIRLAQPPYNLRFRYRKVTDVDPGLELIRDQLREGMCACGDPLIAVNRTMRAVIDGFAGGYHMPSKLKSSKDKPVKDGYYDDFMDAVRYLFWNFVKPALAGSVIDEIERVNRRVRPPVGNWLEPGPTEAQVLAEIEAARRAAR